ncbi:MAG: ATP-binding protein [Candidatus Riflebacteria bacterium]
MSHSNPLKQATEELRVLSKIIKNVSGKVQLDEFLQEIVEDARHYIGVEALNIGLISDATECLEPLWVTGVSPRLARRNFPSIPLSKTDDISIKCLLEKKVVHVTNINENSEVHEDIKVLSAGTSFVLVPLIVDGGAIGLVGFVNNISKSDIDTETIQRYQRFVDTLAMFFNNSRIYAELQLFRQSLEDQVMERTTELKQAHETIWEINENLSAIIENSTIGIIATDPDGAIRIFNRAASFILNTQLSKLSEPGISSLVSKELFNEIFRAKEGEENEFGVLCRNYETEFFPVQASGDGEPVPVSLSVVRLKNRQRKLSGYVFIFQDIREVRFLEAKLIHAEKLKMIGQMSAGISHEMNTPLAMINASAAVIKKNIDVQKDVIVAKHLCFIGEAVARASSFVRDFLNLAKPSKTRLEKAEISEVITKSIDLFRLKSQVRKIDFVVSIAADLLPVYCDVNKLIQVFINLFDNAADAMSGSGEITIKAICREIHPQDVLPDDNFKRRAGDLPGSRLMNFRKFHLRDTSKLPPVFESGARIIHLEVTDRGPGLSSGLIEHVCEPFFSTKTGNGSGLGLAISQSIISEHNGCFQLVSPPGEGVTVIIKLPTFATMERFERNTQ